MSSSNQRQLKVTFSFSVDNALTDDQLLQLRDALSEVASTSGTIKQNVQLTNAERQQVINGNCVTGKSATYRRAHQAMRTLEARGSVLRSG